MDHPIVSARRRPLARVTASVLALAVLGVAAPSALGAPVVLRGTAYEFNRPAERLAGATVRVAERPRLRTTVRADGGYRLAVPDRTRVTPYVEAPGYRTIHLQTFTTAGHDLDRVNFQVPTDATYRALAALLRVPLDERGAPRACAIVSTFSTRDVRALTFDGFVGHGAHGVAGATATASPSLGRPTYFNEMVVPDPAQRRSSEDGGAIWTGVPTGRYVVRAHHPRTRFARFTATCRPGRIVNANPPWGLHQVGLANRVRVRARWTAGGLPAGVRSLGAVRLPRGATVRVACAGRGCPIPTRTLRPGGPRLDLLRAAGHRRAWRTGQVLEVTVAAPRHETVRTRWTVGARRASRARRSCVPLGDRGPGRCTADR